MNYVFSLHVTSPILIPFNFKKALTSSIYHLLSELLPEKMKKIHDNEEETDGKYIKPFSYSNLFFETTTLFKGHGLLVEGNGSLYFSTSDQEIESQLPNLIGKDIILDNSLISISSVKKINIKTNKDVNFVKSLSEVVVSAKGYYNGKLVRRNLLPTDENYIEMLKTNILRKSILINPNKPLNRDDFNLEIISTTKKGKLIQFKQQKIKAYPLCLKVTGSESEHVTRIITTLGLGVKNALGFGYMVTITEKEASSVKEQHLLLDMRKGGA